MDAVPTDIVPNHPDENRWQVYAACAAPDDHSDYHDGRRRHPRCDTRPASEPCLCFGLANEQAAGYRYGRWGGTTPARPPGPVSPPASETSTTAIGIARWPPPDRRPQSESIAPRDPAPFRHRARPLAPTSPPPSRILVSKATTANQPSQLPRLSLRERLRLTAAWPPMRLGIAGDGCHRWRCAFATRHVDTGSRPQRRLRREEGPGLWHSSAAHVHAGLESRLRLAGGESGLTLGAPPPAPRPSPATSLTHPIAVC